MNGSNNVGCIVVAKITRLSNKTLNTKQKLYDSLFLKSNLET